MADSTQTTRSRFWLWLIRVIGVIVPRRFRARFRQEWEAELEYREELLARWDRLDWRNKLELLWRSLGAFWDALWLQRQRWEDDMIQDLRYGMRMLLKNPGFTSVAILTLALGVGANTAIFSFVNSVLLRPLPFDQPEQLVRVYEKRIRQGRMRNPASGPDFLDWRQQQSVFQQMAAFDNWSANLTGMGEPEQLTGLAVTEDMFTLLRVSPARGRAFAPEEFKPGSAGVIALSDGLWRRRFGARDDVIGQTLTLNGQSQTVVGVLPRGFQFFNKEIEFWVPLPINPQSNRALHSLGVIARLKPGVTVGRAQAEMETIAARLEQQYPDMNTGHNVNVFPLHDETVGQVSRGLWVMMSAVGFLMLIACANVANLLLARTAVRKREMAIRAALGGGPWRVIRQLLTESLLLAASGGALGLLLGYWGIDLLIALSPDNTPRLDEVRLDFSALGFTLLLSLLTGIIFGSLPAFQAARPDLTETLKESGRASSAGLRHNRARSLLVIAEVAVALVMLTGAGLMVRSFAQLHAVNPGFDPENVLTVQLSLLGSKYRGPQTQAAFVERALERLVTLPGVQSAGAVVAPPFGRFPGGSRGFEIENRPQRPNEIRNARFNSCSPNYFRTLNTRLLKGRDFTARDAQGQPEVAIINERMARLYWPDEDPLGQHIRITGADSWRLIVGVVGDAHSAKLEVEPGPEMFYPFSQSPYPLLSLMARAAGDPEGLIAAVRGEIHSIDPDLPVSGMAPLDELVAGSIAPQRLNTFLIGLFSALAMTLAAVGIYGVMSYAVAQRTQEIGIRMALGARPRDALKLVVKQGMALALLGVAIGLAASFGLTRLLKTLLFGVSATDPVTFVVIPLLLTLIALLACYLPARRATKVDPLTALRRE
jgi:putative ABC transport system permease protein